jgi:hypothetical protein
MCLLSVELASHHPSSVYIFEVAARFLENFGIQYVTYIFCYVDLGFGFTPILGDVTVLLF